MKNNEKDVVINEGIGMPGFVASDRTLSMNRIPKAFKQLGYIGSDLASAYNNDPAIRGKITALPELLLYAGVWAILFHRFAHLLFTLKIPFLPRLISQVGRFLTGIEIHPGASIGSGFFIDHGNGVVIGETAEIGNNVIMFHQVTLGGRGFATGKRHPTVGSNVMLGAGSKILGPVFIGDNSKIGAGTVVLDNVPEQSVVVGNSGRVVKQFGEKIISPVRLAPSLTGLPDPELVHCIIVDPENSHETGQASFTCQ